MESPRERERMTGDLYETDFYSWSQQQGALLRSGDVHRADLANIAEEIETLGRSEAAALESAYRLIAMHLLKALHQPEMASRSWKASIIRERLNVKRLLRDNPGLKARRSDLFLGAYDDARREASAETGRPLSRFPAVSPFTIGQAEDEAFMPPALARFVEPDDTDRSDRRKARGKGA